MVIITNEHLAVRPLRKSERRRVRHRGSKGRPEFRTFRSRLRAGALTLYTMVGMARNTRQNPPPRARDTRVDRIGNGIAKHTVPPRGPLPAPRLFGGGTGPRSVGRLVVLTLNRTVHLLQAGGRLFAPAEALLRRRAGGGWRSGSSGRLLLGLHSEAVVAYVVVAGRAPEPCAGLPAHRGTVRGVGVMGGGGEGVLLC